MSERKNKARRRRHGRPMRLPNGFGSVIYLGKGRRRPYAAKTTTRGLTQKGYPIRDTLGYYETWDEAYQVLVEYNKNPYDISAKKSTFADVYELLKKKKYQNPAKKLSRSNENVFEAAYKKSKPLHERPITELRTHDMQELLDNLTQQYKHASLEHVKSLWNQMFTLAMEYDIVQKNYAMYVQINKEDDDEHGTPFTRTEIDHMWSVVDQAEGIDIVLVMIYSGFRISAYENLEIDLEHLIFQGGVKTAAGKNRIVPIHWRIVPLVRKLLAEQRLFYVKAHKNRSIFKKALVNAGIEPSNHTPHDCRHTLASMLDSCGTPEKITKLLLGHAAGRDVTNKIYIHKDVEELRHFINMVP